MKTANAFTLTRILLAPVFFLIYFIPIWTGRFAAASALVMIPLLAFTEFTDFLDGHFARKRGEVSDFGKMFDPFADVILHLTTFTCLMHSYFAAILRDVSFDELLINNIVPELLINNITINNAAITNVIAELLINNFTGYIPVFVFILIVYREFSQNFLRMIAAKKGVAIAARKGGKLKTVFYVATSFVCLVPECALRLVAFRGQNVAAPIANVVQNFGAWRNAALVMSLISLALCYISFADYLVHFKSFLKDE